MATQTNKGENPKKNPKGTELSTKQTLGAIGGIAVLLAILLFGVSQSKPAGAELITEEDKPAESVYVEESSPVDYEDAILKEYEAGTDTSSEAIKQVILTFASNPIVIHERQEAHVYGRYIGTLEYENSIGADEVVPAIQVDYISLES